ncbi:glycoside hydrolase family 2 protein [Metabacillus sp. KUDC1714]
MLQSEVQCSDNFFNLSPGETKSIQLRHLEEDNNYCN